MSKPYSIYSRAYPPLPARPDLVGTVWWRVLVEEVAPQYAKLVQTFEKNTVVLMNGNSASSLTYKLGNTSYLYHRRQATAEVVLELIEGVCALQAILNKADDRVEHEDRAPCLLLDLSGVIVQGDLNLPRLDLPQLLCYQTEFGGDADFSECAFEASVCFDRAVFKGKAAFHNAYFPLQSSFRHTIFNKHVCFFCAFGSVLFEYTIFVGFADFEGAIVGHDDLDFDGCHFLGDREFS